MNLTQKEIDNITEVMNEANVELRRAKDKIDTLERIVKTQEELIELLKTTIHNREKFITVLESQLKIVDSVITKEILKG